MSNLFMDLERKELGSAFVSVLHELSVGDFQLECSEDHPASQDRRFFAVVGVVGTHKGRVVLEACEESVVRITQSMNFEEPVADVEEICLYFAELTNMLGGKLVTFLNNSRPSFSLRLTPPAVFTGVDLVLRTPNLKSEVFCFTMGQVVLGVKVSMEGM